MSTVPMGLSSPLFMYQFDLESLARAHAYLGTDVAFSVFFNLDARMNIWSRNLF